MSNAIETIKAKTLTVKEYGDFQTPLHLCHSICFQIQDLKFRPTILIEPSCGKGNFIISALETFPSIKTIIAIEVQEYYRNEFYDNLAESSLINSDVNIIFIMNSFFEINFDQIFTENNIDTHKEKFLILGNPPWVTNSFLGQITSHNIPQKSNRKSKLKALDALTGKSNFDIAETFITELFNYFVDKKFLVAMICKTSTAQSILKRRYVTQINFEYKSYLLNAKKEFGISAKANIFIIKKTCTAPQSELSCSVFNLTDPKRILYSFGYNNDKFVADIDLYNQYSLLDGDFNYQWRQGLKHDASSVLILEKISPGKYRNKLHEIIELEDDLIYPLLKSSDIKNSIITDSKHFILLTQKKIGQDFTETLQQYPKIWSYLLSKKYYFDKRKSKIYNNQNTFSIFGIGDYSFKPYKIVVSGFYKKLNFSLIAPDLPKPVMVDDTCYSLSFDSLNESVLIWILLQSKITKNFFKSIVFIEGKRPYKKENLQRLDLQKLLNEISNQQIKNEWEILSTIMNLGHFNEVEKLLNKFRLNGKI